MSPDAVLGGQIQIDLRLPAVRLACTTAVVPWSDGALCWALLLLQLNQGSVVELDRIAGESLDVMVNGTLIAHGEVVVVNDKFGIRLTDVISQTERIKKLR